MLIDPYPLTDLASVPGFLDPHAALLLDGLARRQTAHGIAGDMAEIGVFYGRSALVLGRALAPSERLTACDRFDVRADDVPGWTFGVAEDPEEHLRRRWAEMVGGADILRVLRRDSATLCPGDLGTGLRLVHVDGDHSYAGTRRDVATALGALSEQGVLVVDDVLLPEWPDVTVAVVDVLRERAGELTPVLVAQHKLVVAARRAADRYGAWAEEVAALAYPASRFLLARRGFLGHEVPVVSRLPE